MEEFSEQAHFFASLRVKGRTKLMRLKNFSNNLTWPGSIENVTAAQALTLLPVAAQAAAGLTHWSPTRNSRYNYDQIASALNQGRSRRPRSYGSQLLRIRAVPGSKVILCHHATGQHSVLAAAPRQAWNWVIGHGLEPRLTTGDCIPIWNPAALKWSPKEFN